MAESAAMTLVFTDLVNSTGPLGADSGDHDERLFHIHHRLLSETAQAHGGRELQWTGNGILAGFTSASDAVKSAIAMQQMVRRPIEGLRLELRIGVHFGEIRHQQSGYFGTALNVARQLCNQGDSGQILCTITVRELLGSRQNFTFKELGRHQPKGSSISIGVCEVVYESNDPVAMLSRTPFVGRSVQQKRLAAKLEEACNGRGSLAMLRGEPGIGKTRLLEEFADAAVHRGATVLRGACYDGEWQQPFGPFAEAIVEYARHASPAELTAALGKRVPVIARIAPALHEVMGDIPEPPPLETDAETFRLFDAVAQFLIAVSRTAPLVLILDDLHWADRGVIGMLNHISHFAPSHPILVVGAYRDAEVTRSHPLAAALAAISRLRNFESLSLRGLTSEEVAELLELIGDQGAPGELVKALTESTEGNPLFIRELLMHLVEEGKILHEGSGWISKISIEDLGIPDGVRQIIDRRLEKLSDDAKRLLSAGAAFNGSFAFSLATAVADLEERAALGAIDEAIEAQLVRPAPQPDSFDFTHALIRQTLYTGMNSVRRVRLHRRIAEEMERTWGEHAAEHAAEVAFHFWRGATSSGTERGADYAIAAADNAAAAFAHDEVAAFLRIALELLAPNDPRRPRVIARRSFALTWSLNAEEALTTALEAGKLIVASEGAGPGAEYYEQIARAMYNAGLTMPAWQLAREGLRYTGKERDITWASLTEIDITRREAEDPENPGIAIETETSIELREVLARLPQHQLTDRNIERPYSSRQQIMADPSPAPRVYLRTGDYRKALMMWQQEAAETEQRGALARATRAWASAARCHNAMGNFVEARAGVDRASALAARVGLVSFGMVTLLGVQTELRFAIDDDWTDLLTTIRGVLKVPDPKMFTTMTPENKWALAAAASYGACMYAHTSERELALEHLEFVMPAIRVGAAWSVNYCLMTGAAAATAWMLESTEHAPALEESIREKVVGPDFHFPLWDGRLSLARLCAIQRRHDEAVEWFAKARTVLEENGSRPLRAICDHDEALMYLRRHGPSDIERAQPLLAAALEQFIELGMTGWIRRAHEAARID